MKAVSEAVILMAGEGSRLRGADKTILKPFVPVLGRPLISYILETLTTAGINTVHFVVGYESERMIAQVKQLIPSSVSASFIKNHDWQKQNGISLLAAASHVTSPFLLTMGDHLFDRSIIDLLFANAFLDELNLAIDRKLDSIFDLDDAMKVQTRGDRIFKIGKDLRGYDAIDTGLFVCPPDIFSYLESSRRDGDCSLADGVRSIAAKGRARAIDIGDAWWKDIDTPQMLAQAEEHLRVRGLRTEPVLKNS